MVRVTIVYPARSVGAFAAVFLPDLVLHELRIEVDDRLAGSIVCVQRDRCRHDVEELLALLGKLDEVFSGCIAEPIGGLPVIADDAEIGIVGGEMEANLLLYRVRILVICR